MSTGIDSSRPSRPWTQEVAGSENVLIAFNCFQITNPDKVYFITLVEVVNCFPFTNSCWSRFIIFGVTWNSSLAKRLTLENCPFLLSVKAISSLLNAWSACCASWTQSGPELSGPWQSHTLAGWIEARQCYGRRRSNPCKRLGHFA